MSKRSFGLFSLMVAGLFILAACADPQQPTATVTLFDPTPGGAPGAVATPSGATTVPQQPTSVPEGPDVAAGQATFNTTCSGCHKTDSTTLVGPGLGGVGDRAGSRIAGVSADDYIRMSITEPGSFIVDGFGPIMPKLTQLTPQDIENLLGYLKTLQ